MSLPTIFFVKLRRMQNFWYRVISPTTLTAWHKSEFCWKVCSCASQFSDDVNVVTGFHEPLPPALRGARQPFGFFERFLVSSIYSAVGTSVNRWCTCERDLNRGKDVFVQLEITVGQGRNQRRPQLIEQRHFIRDYHIVLPNCTHLYIH